MGGWIKLSTFFCLICCGATRSNKQKEAVPKFVFMMLLLRKRLLLIEIEIVMINKRNGNGSNGEIRPFVYVFQL